MSSITPFADEGEEDEGEEVKDEEEEVKDEEERISVGQSVSPRVLYLDPSREQRVLPLASRKAPRFTTLCLSLVDVVIGRSLIRTNLNQNE